MRRTIIVQIVLLLEMFTAPLWACTKKIVLSASEPLKDQLKNKSVIYVVKFSFDLKGDVLVFPSDCQMSFEGGTIKNGGLRGNNTSIL